MAQIDLLFDLARRKNCELLVRSDVGGGYYVHLYRVMDDRGKHISLVKDYDDNLIRLLQKVGEKLK